MEPPQHGESSRSPSGQAPAQISLGNGSNGHDGHVKDKMSRLILGNWDIPPEKHVHASHDLISILNLDGLYNTYVRPFADAVGPEDAEKQDEDGENTKGTKKKKNKGKRKLEKGYHHLIDDCIDPTPLGEKRETLSILPLIPEQLDPNRPPLDLGARPTMLAPELFQNARLEAGLKQEGYSNGIKIGVAAEEEKRKKKRLRQSLSLIPDLPSPGKLPYDYSSAGPGTPHQPIAPPRHPFSANALRRGSASFRPSTPARPISTPQRSYHTGTLPNKRPGDALSSLNVKRSKPAGGSRSASPMPQAVSTPQGRPGVGKQARSQTEF